MPKLKRTAQVKEANAVKNTNTFVTKKQRKMKNNESSNDVHKNDLKKLEASDKAMNTFTSKKNSNKKKKRGDKFDVKDTEKSNIPIKHLKDDKMTSEISQKVQLNTDGKIKRKMKNKDKLDAKIIERVDVPTKYSKEDQKTEILQKVQMNTSKIKSKKRGDDRKEFTNFDRLNKNTARIDDTKERKRKLQARTKESIDFEHKRTKIEKFKKISEKKMKRILVEAEAQQMKPDTILKLNKHMIKIRRLEEMFTNKSQMKKALKDKITTQLKVTRFKFINEMLHNNNSSQSKCYFKEDPDAFKAYQAGYKWQLEQWAMNPLDVIISSIRKLSTDNVIADFGCGEARLAASVPHTVYSFDFIALNDRVNACDMAHTPLRMDSVHVVVFCLSLMGSNLQDYIIEANRVLKNNGLLKIAEVKNRFGDVKDFIKLLRSYGFKNIWKDLSHDLFFFMDFKKEKNINVKRKVLPPITLKSSEGLFFCGSRYLGQTITEVSKFLQFIKLKVRTK